MMYTISPSLSWKDIQGQVLILDPRGTNQAHELSSLGSYIWFELSQNKNVDEIIEKLCANYNSTSKETIQSDVLSYIHHLEQLKLISRV